MQRMSCTLHGLDQHEESVATNVLFWLRKTRVTETKCYSTNITTFKNGKNISRSIHPVSPKPISNDFQIDN